jgi:diguanylate cyclase (GGDEF)-like protein
MSINNPAFSKFDSLRTRYISGATTLLILCVLFSSLAYLNVSNMLTSAATGSRYQQQYRNHLNDFSESFFNIEKLLMYYPQASNEVVYKQLLDNLNKAEDSLQKIEYGRWFIAHEQRNVIAEIHSYISTYKLRISWQMNADISKDNVVLDSQPDIDTFAEDLWPMVDNVRQSINKLENELETLSVIERSRIADVEEFLLFIFIGGICLIIGFLLINFVAIKRWVINPLLLLTDDINTDSDFSKRCYTNVLEINGLFNSLENRCLRNSKREDKLKYQVMHDPLTGLPNRVMLRNTLQSAIDDADKTGTQFTLLMIDLDRFKEINDTLGHHVGDKVLCEISKRFKFVLSQRDVIARLGGDEFAVLLYDTDIEKARFTAQELLNCFKDDMLLEGHRFNIGGSIGMAVYPWHAKNERELLQRADVAMYFAKRKNFGYAIYDKSEDKHDIRQLGFEVELRDAIENNELTLHYQPKIDIKSKQVVSVEVLLRWNHKEHGFIPAEEISMLAEKTGLITDLSKWVVLTAVNQLSLWVKKGIELPGSINLSVWNLQDPDFFSFVETF